MNLLAIRNLALKLANSYSSEGVELPAVDTLDFKLASLDFANLAQIKFSEKDKVEDTLTIEQESSDVGNMLYPLPAGFLMINKVIFLETDRNNRVLFRDYTIEKGEFIIDAAYDGTFLVYYFKTPAVLEDDDDIPEIQAQYHSYLAYFMAGTWLLTTGHEQTGVVLLNIFDNFMAEMKADTSESGNRIEQTNGW